ncbi:MAG: hypothetical protein U0946_06285 [Patescibacteria group bacterium]|nr:hypothetical protein [Patescibacteria group bacterium]
MPELPATPTELSIAQALEIANQCPKSALILDVDETGQNAVPKYFAVVSRLILRSYPNLTIPNYAAILAAGSIETAFPKELRPEIETIMDRIRNHRISVKGLPLIHPELPSILTQAQGQGHPVAMYLTTRPDALAKLTAIELQRNNFPKAPVVARPASVDRSRTTWWKLNVLKDLADKSPHGIIMVDDSPTLNAAITEANLQNLHSILIAGPITPKNSNAITWDQFTDRLQTFS